MKKFLAMLLAMLMVLCSVAFADEEPTTSTDPETPTTTPAPYEDHSTINMYKNWVVTGENAETPEQTFSFTVKTDAIEGNDAATFPTTLPTVTSAVYAEGEFGRKTLTITLPTYEKVGVYKYIINEVVPSTKTAGVGYFEGDITLVVTVVYDETNGQVRVAAVHCENPITSTEYGVGTKTDEFTNTYKTGNLKVTKQVQGVLGDKTKKFDITIAFTAADGTEIKSDIMYSINGAETLIDVVDNEVTVSLAHNDSVTFYNIPENVTYEVTEKTYDGYEQSVTYSDTNQTIAVSDEDEVTVINTKGGTVDTGITLDNAPYMILMGLVVLAGAALIVKRSFNH